MIIDVATVMARFGRRAAPVASSSWTAGILVAIATWSVAFVVPFLGLDPSWWAGLYMGAHFGLHFGTQVIFTYGPLGFLGLPWLWYSNLAVLAFLYQASLHVALAVSIVWALRRRLSLALAVVAAFFVSVTAPSADLAVALASIWCVAALVDSAARFAGPLVLFGGATLGTIELLVEFRPGLAVLAMCALTLLGRGRAWRNVPAFVMVCAAEFAALWFAAGQGGVNLGRFTSNAFQIVSGYSQAMGEPAASAIYLVGELALGVLLVLGAAFASLEVRARAAATVAVGVAVFSIYKEAVVRADFGHTAIFFATAVFVMIAISAWLRPAIVIAAIVALTAVNIYLDDRAGLSVSYNPFGHASQAVDQLRLLFSPHRRALDALYGAVLMVDHYRLPATMLGLLRGHTVDVDPWEAGLAWAYGLNWRPLPVLQDYSAYTGELDRLDAEALRSPRGPQRILRENPALVDPTYRTATIDNRFAGWDPPAKTLAMLCNFDVLQTSHRWEVLAKAPDRCGPPKLIRSISVAAGRSVTVPHPRPGTVIYAAVTGAGVSGLEQLRALVYRARFRYVVVNGSTKYRLVPGTAGDGLLLAAAPGVDYPAPFAVSPGARTLRFLVPGGPLRIEFYEMAVRRLTSQAG